MKITCSDLRHHVAIRPRVAFVLAIAERITPVLEKNEKAYTTAIKALGDGWRWEEGESISGRQLYDGHVGSLAVQGSIITDKVESAGLGTTISAFYYLVWHAFWQDVANGEILQGEIPNDMFEVTEEVVDEVCQFAAQTPLYDSRWIVSLIERITKRLSFG